MKYKYEMYSSFKSNDTGKAKDKCTIYRTRINILLEINVIINGYNIKQTRIFFVKFVMICSKRNMKNLLKNMY